jgi:uncharacterized protein (TIGR03000 family)
MRLLSNTRLFQAAVVAAGIVAFSSTDALAWGRRGGSSGSSGSSASYGSYGSSGSSASYASSASYGSYGSSGSSASSGSSGKHGGGLFARWHARKAAKHSSGSSASYASSASYGSYGSSGSSASYGGYASSGSSGSYGGGGYSAPVEYYEGAPAEYYEDAPVEVAPEAAVETEASIRVTVPAEAQVFVNDRLTTSTGGERSFVSRGLQGGRTYAYQLRVEFVRDGETVVENKLVRLQAGEQIDLSFGAGEQLASEEEATTELTLHVPADATVTLAGAATRQTGESRTYATAALTAGQEWAGYVVRVELQRDGQTLVEEKTLSIVGGENYELSFEFAEPAAQVASLD